MSRSVVVAFVSIVLHAINVSAREPTLTVVWNDHNGVFPPHALRLLADELHQLFAGYGISVRLHVARVDENVELGPALRVNAIVTAAEGARYRVPRDAMAATIGDRRGRNIFVFLPGLSRALGHERSVPVARRARELSRAMARVLAHEIVHVLAPERPHTDGGLMSAKLERQHLVRSNIDFDASSLGLVRTKLREWAEQSRSVLTTSPC
jgi:hypothetical protein